MKKVLQDAPATAASHVLTQKPLMRGWSHALAALAALVLTIAFCWQSRADLARLISLLIFGLSMLELYTISALYHIGHWSPRRARVLRAIDHANIFVMIAGTYTRIVPREIVPVGMILRLFLGTLSAWEDSLSLLSCPCDQPVISEILKKMGTISHDPSAF